MAIVLLLVVVLSFSNWQRKCIIREKGINRNGGKIGKDKMDIFFLAIKRTESDFFAMWFKILDLLAFFR